MKLGKQFWNPRIVATPVGFAIISEPTNQSLLEPFWRQLKLLADHGLPDEYFRMSKFGGYDFECHINLMCVWPNQNREQAMFVIAGPGDGISYKEGMEKNCVPISLDNYRLGP